MVWPITSHIRILVVFSKGVLLDHMIDLLSRRVPGNIFENFTT